jgi:hypothetical protein
VDDKVELKLFLKTQHFILEDLDDSGYRKKNASVDEVRQILKKNPKCLHTMDFQLIVPPKESEDTHFVPATKLNDLDRFSIWINTTIVASGEDIGDGINAPTIADTKTAILRMGGVLDADVGISKCPQFLLDRYMSVIQKKNIYVILSTGENVFMRTESDNIVSIFTKGTRYHYTNACSIPGAVFQSGKRYSSENQNVINYFTFCEKKNRKWLGRMAVDHMNRDSGDNRKVNLRLVV